MDRFCPSLFCGGNDFIPNQITFRRRGRANMHLLIRHRDMEGISVGIRIDRHGLNAHLPGGIYYTTGDFSPVGNQNF